MTPLLERLRQQWRPVQEAASKVWNLSGGVGVVVRAVVSLLGIFGLFLCLQVLFANNQPPVGTYVYGAILGLLYGLVACGLILVFRANRIINFANAEIGAMCATLAVLLMKSRFHVPYLVAFALAIAVAAAVGAVVEYLIIRRFALAPRLILSVATIGLGLIFAGIQFFLPQAITGRLVDPGVTQTLFTRFGFSVGGTNFDGNHVVAMVVVAILLVGLVSFFKFTDVGLAVRASAENRDRAWLLGIPVKRISTIVWILSSVLAAIGVFLRAPIVGLPIGSLVGPTVLLYALAAAVIARMERFEVAMVASIVIGMVDHSFYSFSRDPNLSAAIVLPVLLVVLLLQRVRESRGKDTGIATWSLGQEFRPVPPELRWLPEVQWGQFAVRTLLVLGALGAPFVMSVFQRDIASLVLIYGVVAVTLVVLVGWAGQISLGQWGFVGIGAATAGGMYKLADADFIVAILTAGVVGATAAVLIGLPALRIQGLYLAVTTLAFAIAVQVYLLSPPHSGWLLPDRSKGIERPLLYSRFDLANDKAFYYFTLAILILALCSARSLRASRTGRVLIASRDNPKGAQSYGVSVTSARLTAFAFAGFWCGLAGGLFAYHQQAIDTLAFGPTVSLDVLVMVVLGGLTTLPGALLGTGVLAFFEYGRFSQSTQFLASGVGVLVILLALPGGLAQLLYGGRDALLRKVAERRGLHVPSLVADSGAEPGPVEEVDVTASVATLEGTVAFDEGLEEPPEPRQRRTRRRNPVGTGS